MFPTLFYEDNCNIDSVLQITDIHNEFGDILGQMKTA